MTPQEIAKILSANNEILLKKIRRIIREELEMVMEKSSFVSSVNESRKSKIEPNNIDMDSLKKILNERHGSKFDYKFQNEKSSFDDSVDQSDIKTLNQNFVDPDNPEKKLNVDAKTVTQIYKDYGDII